MKKVLIVSYFFPPVGGGGVIRLLKFVKYLPDFGFKPYVLTVKKAFYPIKDSSLVREIPTQAEVERISYFEPGFWFGWRAWQSLLSYAIYPFFLLPDRQSLWIWKAFFRARRIIKKERIKTVLTSSAPASDHLVGLLLKKLCHIYWVADFRDEWSDNPLKKYPTSLHRRLDKFFQNLVLKNVDKIITVSEPLSQSLSTVARGKVTTITNGYDNEDFRGFKSVPHRGFNLVYTGTVYDSRLVEPFYQAFKESGLKDARVIFIGHEKRLSHRQAVKELGKADVLLLFLDAVERPAVLTGKIFEYLAAGKPILALAPENTAASKMIKDLKAGVVVPPNDKVKIKEKINYFYNKYQKKALKQNRVPIEQFERKNLTKKLAEILDQKKPIKLLMIGNIRSPQNRDLLRYLDPQKFKVVFVSAKPGNYRGIKVHSLPLFKPTWWYFLRTAWRIKKIIKEEKPDFIHGQDMILAGLWACISGFKPYAITLWGSDINNYSKFPVIEKILVKETLKNAALVTAPAQHLLKKARNVAGTLQKTALVHFGVDMEIFKKEKPTVNKNKIIFCPRSIAPIYNTDILIESYKSLKAKAKLVLVSQNADEQYLLAIENMIIKYDLVDDVRILGKLSSKQMASWMNSSDLIVTLASSDGCARSFLEAMATEKKIVITEIDFIKEWIDGNNFWRVPVRDVAATRKAILNALNYPDEKFVKTGRKNREMVAKRAEIKTNFENLQSLYEEL